MSNVFVFLNLNSSIIDTLTSDKMQELFLHKCGHFDSNVVKQCFALTVCLSLMVQRYYLFLVSGSFLLFITIYVDFFIWKSQTLTHQALFKEGSCQTQEKLTLGIIQIPVSITRILSVQQDMKTLLAWYIVSKEKVSFRMGPESVKKQWLAMNNT